MLFDEDDKRVTELSNREGGESSPAKAFLFPREEATCQEASRCAPFSAECSPMAVQGGFSTTLCARLPESK